MPDRAIQSADQKRKYQREYAARQRAKDLVERNRGQDTCQKHHGSGTCGGKLELRRVEGGYARVCQLCVRQAMGICRDCIERVEGRRGTALRCAVHKAHARNAQIRASENRHHDEYLAAARARLAQRSDEDRARQNEYRRAWRKVNRDKVRAQKLRETQRKGPARKHRLKYHAKLNRKRSRILRKRQMAMVQYYRDHPDRPQPKCAGCSRYLDWSPMPGGVRGRPPKWCDDCAPKYEKARRAQLGRTIKACDEPPLVAYVPALKEIEAMFAPGTRTCVTPGCDIVVTHRKKMCTKCKAREAEAAMKVLAERRGRGRRTDLERVA